MRRTVGTHMHIGGDMLRGGLQLNQERNDRVRSGDETAYVSVMQRRGDGSSESVDMSMDMSIWMCVSRDED